MANSIIGRQKESVLLDELYQSGKAELVAVYGCMRIGYHMDDEPAVGQQGRFA